MSPTYSQMINTISFDDEDFEINKDLLRKDFYSEANKKRKDWFFNTLPKAIGTIYQEEFYAYLRQEKKNIKFWIWFELFKQKEYLDYPYKRIRVKAKAFAEEKGVFISAYLQDLHIYFSAIPGIRVPSFDNSKICRSISESLLHQ